MKRRLKPKLLRGTIRCTTRNCALKLFDGSVCPLMRCGWKDCIEEIGDDIKKHLSSHIDEQKELGCLWKDCHRYGEPQANKHTLLAHVRRHTGERPFECHICGRDYTRSDPLKKHLIRHEFVENRNRDLMSQVEYLSSLLEEHHRESVKIMNDIELTRYNIEAIDREIVNEIRKNSAEKYVSTSDRF